eukprot:GHUV01031505.1.p1 GENE.GHUV01031505.1~~GHUV01031505.1.p1  ORF type:complete len:182 (-),score=38.70 GHUV01031505.1:611-1156(-)
MSLMVPVSQLDEQYLWFQAQACVVQPAVEWGADASCSTAPSLADIWPTAAFRNLVAVAVASHGNKPPNRTLTTQQPWQEPNTSSTFFGHHTMYPSPLPLSFPAANDVANAFGTSVGSRTLKLWSAVVIAAIFEFLGAMLLGGQVTKTIAGGIAKTGTFTNAPYVFMYGKSCTVNKLQLRLQ